MSHHTFSYEDVLHAAGCRVTPQRATILDAVCEGKGHTTHGEIYARAHHHDPALDRSTVYRTLKLFVKIGLVVATTNAIGETVYEIAHDHAHHHLLCTVCGKDTEVDTDVFNTLFGQVSERYGFRVETLHITLRGVCKACQVYSAPDVPI